jgi:hypothetical protein
VYNVINRSTMLSGTHDFSERDREKGDVTKQHSGVHHSGADGNAGIGINMGMGVSGGSGRLATPPITGPTDAGTSVVYRSRPPPAVIALEDGGGAGGAAANDAAATKPRRASARVAPSDACAPIGVALLNDSESSSVPVDGRSSAASSEATSEGGGDVGRGPGGDKPVPMLARKVVTIDPAAITADVATTLLVFSPTNKIRVFLTKVVEQPLFETSILTLICLSSALIALDSPLMNPSSTLKQFVDYSDFVFTALFAAEMVTKLIVFGFIGGTTSLSVPSVTPFAA